MRTVGREYGGQHWLGLFECHGGAGHKGLQKRAIAVIIVDFHNVEDVGGAMRI